MDTLPLQQRDQARQEKKQGDRVTFHWDKMPDKITQRKQGFHGKHGSESVRQPGTLHPHADEPWMRGLGLFSPFVFSTSLKAGAAMFRMNLSTSFNSIQIILHINALRLVS